MSAKRHSLILRLLLLPFLLLRPAEGSMMGIAHQKQFENWLILDSTDDF